MVNSILLASLHKEIKIGTEVTIHYEPRHARGTVYIFCEINHDLISVSDRREGGYTDTLPKTPGFRQLMQDMHWDEHDNKRSMGIFMCELDGKSGKFTVPETTRTFVGGMAVKPAGPQVMEIKENDKNVTRYESGRTSGRIVQHVGLDQLIQNSIKNQ